MADTQDNYVVVGKIVGVHGVRGWVKVFSYTQPKENIFSYAPWRLKVNGGWQAIKVVDYRKQGKGLVAQLDGVDDRDQAHTLIETEIAITRDQLPAAGKDEYYWADLVGLEVVTREAQSLGRVDHLISTGANDVLVVKGERERLIPFVQGQFVLEVDLEGGRIQVDWDPEF